MNMETKKIYVRPSFEAIDMDVCVLTGWSANKGVEGGKGSVDVDGGDGLAPGYHGPIDDTPVSDDD